MDSNILPPLRDACRPAEIHAVIVEPDGRSIRKYQDLVTLESAKFHGVVFDWRQQTFEEYMETSEGDDKFHFISCVSSIYFMGDLNKTLPFMYERLDEGGLLLVTMSPGNCIN